MKNFLLVTILFHYCLSFSQISETKQVYNGCKFLEKPNYIINKNSVYFEKCAIHRKVPANVSSFKTVGEGLAYDDKNIFFNGMKLDITPNKPSIIHNQYRMNSTVYWKNNNFLYKNTLKINKIDTSSYQHISYSNYSKDKDGIYYLGKTIKEADTETFVSESPYGFDKNFVYYKNKKIRKNGFLKSINGYFFKDSTTVYKRKDSYSEKLVPILNLKTENCKSILGTKYAIINDTLYYLNRKTKITNLNLEKVKVLDEELITYENTLFYKGVSTQKLEVNSLKIHKGDSRYRKTVFDKNGVYNIRVTSHNNEFLIENIYALPKPLRHLSPLLENTTQISFSEEDVLKNNYSIDKKTLFTSNGITDFNNLEVVSVLKGYRPGCSQDHNPGSNYYILKNKKGYWELKLSAENVLKFIGETYEF